MFDHGKNKMTIWVAELDMDTFKVMWDLSAPGGGAEDCFLRIDQTDYYREKDTKPNPLEMMPDVSLVIFAFRDKYTELTGTNLLVEVRLRRCLNTGSSQRDLISHSDN